jgi:hypothetical protein
LSNVVPFSGLTKGEVPVDNVLEGAKGRIKRVLVLGITHDDMLYAASSDGKASELLWMVEQWKYHLMNGDYDA